MFSIFKNKEQNKIVKTQNDMKLDVDVFEKKSNNEIIQEIHDSYDEAYISILSWAKSIIEKENNVDILKGERLINLGFTNTIKAIFSEKEIKLKKEAKEKAELINYYLINYPFQKFITNNDVKNINKKYNLVCVTSDCYIGDIPEKNLEEIENFKIKNKKDLLYQVTLNHNKYIETFNFIEYEESLNEIYTDRKEEPFYISCPQSETIVRRGYSVREDGFILKDKEIKDPIVLKPVVGGFLIITKWGLEGNDKSLTNETLN